MTKFSLRAACVAALTLVLAFGLAASAAPASADGRSVKVNLTGTVKRGGDELPIEKVKEVRPGEELKWTFSVQNGGAGPVSGVRVEGLIDKGTIYVPGSARGDEGAEVLFSADGGQSFSPRPMVKQRGADGVERDVPAPVSSYTHVQFLWPGQIAPGAQLSATYTTSVK